MRAQDRAAYFRGATPGKGSGSGMQITGGLGPDTLSASSSSPGGCQVTRWCCLAGSTALQTVPSPCGGTGGLEGHWDRARGWNCSSSKVCLWVSTALCPMALVPKQPWYPHALLLPQGSQAQRHQDHSGRGTGVGQGSSRGSRSWSREMLRDRC